MRRFRRGRDGGVDVALPAAEAALLRDLPPRLRELLTGPAGPDPVMERLFPRAYLDPTEERAEEEWRSLAHPELLRDRLEALDAVAGALGRGRERRGRVEVSLTGDEADAWMRALNDLRLALGTRLGVTEELDVATVPDDHPDAPQLAVYAWLTWLQGDLVEALLG